MTDLRTRLRDALRDGEDERLSPEEAAAMRRLVVVSARDAGSEPARTWLPPLAVAATVVAMVGIGVVLGGHFDARPSPPALDGTAAGLSDPQMADAGRQLHFSTPSGTRIIWIFNSHLDLKTTP